MDINAFRQLAYQAYMTHNQAAEELEGEDGSVAQDDLITYIHEMAVATAVAEIAKLVIAATETRTVAQGSVTLQ